MRFSKVLISTLKNFATITSGIYLRPGAVINTKTQTGSIYAEVRLPDGEEVDLDVAIYDLNAFLSILSLAGEDSDVSVGRDGIIISGDRSTINWPAADLDSIIFPKKAIDLPPHQVEFNLSADDYNQIMKISRSLGAEKLAISNVDGYAVISSFAKSDTEYERPLSTFKVAEVDAEKDFNFIIDMRNMKVQNDDYLVKLWAQGTMFATCFESTNAKYIISVEADSSHAF